MTKIIRVFLVLFLFGLLLFMATGRVGADSLWEAKYWNNKNLSGDPVLVRQEAEINHDWGNGAPSGVTGGQFSARWLKSINVSPGTYRFTATMDDGMRVWVDNALILDAWYDSQVRSLAANVYLTGGDHDIKVEYYEAGGQAVAKMNIMPVDVSISRWRGEYFNNVSLTGTPALVRDDQKIDFDWGGGSPAWGVVNADQFSVRWTRTIDLEPGRYRWMTTTDDGVRLWINGRLLIDKWFNQAQSSYAADMDLPGGPTEVRMEYFEDVGGAVAKLSRTKVGGPTGSSSWRGEYFNNRDLSGKAVLVRDDAHIDFNWGNGSPAPEINSDNFSARWTRTLYLSPGRYRFTANTDDGVRVWVNGQRIINEWHDHKPQDFHGEIDLPGGYVDVKMEYYEGVGGAKARLTRTQISVQPAPTPVPQQPSSLGTATVASARLNLRQGPAPTFDIIQVLGQGETLTLLGRNEAATWVQVRTANGVQGWVYAPLIQTSTVIGSLPQTSGQPNSPATTGPTAVVSNAIYALNVRSGPGVTFEPITTVSRGQTVTLIGRSNGNAWLKIRLSNGTEGWSSATYLRTDYDLNRLPVLS